MSQRRIPNKTAKFPTFAPHCKGRRYEPSLASALGTMFVVLLSILLSTRSLFASDLESAIVIFNASIVDEERVIKNICLLRKSPCDYLDPKADFVTLKPGRYRLLNIDFTDNEKTGRGNINFEEIVHFRFKKERIYFIGHLKLSDRKVGGYKMEFQQDLTLLVNSCKKIPQSAMKFPLANAITGKEIEMDCERILRSGT